MPRVQTDRQPIDQQVEVDEPPTPPCVNPDVQTVKRVKVEWLMYTSPPDYPTPDWQHEPWASLDAPTLIKRQAAFKEWLRQVRLGPNRRSRAIPTPLLADGMVVQQNEATCKPADETASMAARLEVESKLLQQAKVKIAQLTAALRVAQAAAGEATAKASETDTLRADLGEMKRKLDVEEERHRQTDKQLHEQMAKPEVGSDAECECVCKKCRVYAWSPGREIETRKALGLPSGVSARGNTAAWARQILAWGDKRWDTASPTDEL